MGRLPPSRRTCAGRQRTAWLCGALSEKATIPLDTFITHKPIAPRGEINKAPSILMPRGSERIALVIHFNVLIGLAFLSQQLS